MRTPRTFVLLIFLLALAAWPARAHAAAPSSELAWNPAWPTFRPIEYALTGVAGGAELLVDLEVKPPSQPHWTGGILFDDAVRDAIRLRSPSARDAARTASDITAVSSAVFAVGVDSIAVPLARGSGRVAFQLAAMDAEAFAFSSLVTTTMYSTIGRARPSYADCQRNPSFDPLCNTGATASFPSGHSSTVFTAAGLSCAHHANLALYGSPLADALGCAGVVTIATATATLRVMGDRHYASDVFVGALIGFGFGFGVPTFLHYGMHDRAGSTVSAMTVSPMGEAPGVVVSGIF